MNEILIPRLPFLIVLLACIGLLSFAYFAEHVWLLEPCPLCILQRVAFMIMAMGALLGMAHGSVGPVRWLYVAIIGGGALWGATTAGRHLWLQALPPEQVPDCGPGLEFMLEYFGVFEALKSAFTGSGECAEVDFSLLGLSMPGWTLICYVLLTLIAVYGAARMKTWLSH